MPTPEPETTGRATGSGSDECRPVLAIGSFDGIHLGHQRILHRAAELAGAAGSPLAVLTYEPLPAQFVHPDFTYVLTPLKEKVRLLLELGVADIHVLRFSGAVRRTGPTDFINRWLLPLAPRAVVAGHDHRFGRGGRGDVGLLREQLGRHGIGVEVVPEFRLLGAPVRSTRVRERLLLGSVARAARLLGRPYTLSGRVVGGTATGRLLGFPTLNIALEEPGKLVPADGVYAARVEVNGQLLPGVLNIGHRPTFRGEHRSIEVHVLDAGFTIPPEFAAAHFVERLRPERRFDSPEALARQIADDAALARRLLAQGQTLDIDRPSNNM